MLEAVLATRRKSVTFPDAIESLYNIKMDAYHQKVMAKGIVPILVVYNLFLIADLLLTPETFLLATFLHFAVVSPIILAAAYLFRRVSRPRVRDAIALTIPALIIAQIMTIYWLNDGPGADQYQYLAISTLIYMNMNLRLGYRLAVVSTLTFAAVYGAMLFAHGAPFEVKFMGFCLMAAGANMSLFASRRMELDLRYNFLIRTRDQMLREGAEEVAKRDALTGLANRRKLDEVVEVVWTAEVAPDWPIAVVMLDIDHFKAYNDRYGHSAGDICLKRIAGVIASELRDEHDLAVRLGGEEFLLLLPGADEDVAVLVADRIRRDIKKIGIPHEHFGPRGVVTASLGVAAGRVSDIDFADLTAHADAALYAAKNRGRNRALRHSEYRETHVAPLRRPPSAEADTARPAVGERRG